MRVLDLFAGLGGWSAAARDRGHDVRTLDLEARFGCTYTADILDVTPATFGDWRPELVLASPPCERFSVLRIGHNWTPQGAPKNPGAELAVEIVVATLRLIADLAPARGWIIENPRAKLRVLPVMDGLARRTVTYCQLGNATQKPTDLWGGFPFGLELPPMCKPGADCHLAAPNGSRSGIQGGDVSRITMAKRRDRQLVKDGWSGDIARYGTHDKPTLAALRALVPYRLGELVVEAAERSDVPVPAPVLPAYAWQTHAGLLVEGRA